MDTGRILGRGMGFPPRVDASGRMVWSEGEANIRESIRIILMTEQEELLRRLAELRGEAVAEPESGLFSRIKSAFR